MRCLQYYILVVQKWAFRYHFCAKPSVWRKLETPILATFAAFYTIDHLAILVAKGKLVLFYQPTLLGKFPHWSVGKRVAVVGCKWLVCKVEFIAINLHWAVVVRTVVLSSFDVHFRSNALDAEALAHWLYQKSGRCGNNQVVILALVEVPLFDVLLVLVPKLFYKTFFVGDKHQKPTHHRRELAVVD